MPHLTPDRARRAITEHTRRLAEAASAAGPRTPVPTTPAWTVADLVTHVGGTQHWTAEIMERRVTDFADDALAAPVLNAAGDDREGSLFWLLNVLNEAVVHGADGALAADRAPEVAADVAAALVDHHLAMLVSPTWAMARPGSASALQGTGQTLQWRADDTGDAWQVERRPAGAVWRAGTGPADATVTGPAGPLLLALTRRLPVADAGLQVDGDAALVRHWLDHTAHVAD